MPTITGFRSGDESPAIWAGSKISTSKCIRSWKAGGCTGSGLLEPWHPDPGSFRGRVEGTLQSIRRKAFVTVTPAEGGYLIGVEAYKELEDVAAAANSAGAATFLENNAQKRDLVSVVGQAAPSGWIPKGRDADLERMLLNDLHAAFSQ